MSYSDRRTYISNVMSTKTHSTDSFIPLKVQYKSVVPLLLPQHSIAISEVDDEELCTHPLYEALLPSQPRISYSLPPNLGALVAASAKKKKKQ